MDLDPLSAEDIKELHRLIANHAKITHSATAEAMLADWEQAQQSFVKVMPRDYKAALQKKNLQIA